MYDQLAVADGALGVPPGAVPERVGPVAVDLQVLEEAARVVGPRDPAEHDEEPTTTTNPTTAPGGVRARLVAGIVVPTAAR